MSSYNNLRRRHDKINAALQSVIENNFELNQALVSGAQVQLREIDAFISCKTKKPNVITNYFDALAPILAGLQITLASDNSPSRTERLLYYLVRPWAP
jgi:hypothetical protein